jgi:hypothetical protein
MNQGAVVLLIMHGPCLHGRQSTAACRLGHHRPWLPVAGCNKLLVASRLATSSRAPGCATAVRRSTFTPSRDMIAGHVRQVEIRRRFSRYLGVACLGFLSWPLNPVGRRTFLRRDLAAAAGGGQQPGARSPLLASTCPPGGVWKTTQASWWVLLVPA